MRNFKIILQYEGTKYQGWQRQESTGNTIQGRLEAVLSKMCGTPVEVQGASRTDAGVHALGQTAHFKLPVSVKGGQQAQTEPEPAAIMAYMNRYLPEDIGVIDIAEVPSEFHSRLAARAKTYQYRVINSTVPHIFQRRLAWVVEEPLDMEAMRQAAAFLVGTHDFSAFTSHKRANKVKERDPDRQTTKNKKFNIRTVHEINISRHGDEISFHFYGNGFLFHMIRILVGTLIEAGMGKRKPEEMQTVLDSHTRENAGMLAPAKGLTLVEVHYS